MRLESNLGNLAFIAVLLVSIVLVPVTWAEDPQVHDVIIGWIGDNKQWLFSGVLVAVPIAMLTLIGQRRKRSKRTPSQQQRSGDGSQNIQTGDIKADGDVNITVVDQTDDGPEQKPAPPPPIWNILQPRNLNFTGRDELLDTLRCQLTSDSTDSSKPTALTQAIAGLGGVGKTQLALEYAYRHQEEYSVVWWVSSEDDTELTEGYTRLAQKLNLPEKDQPDTERIEAVRSWLEQHEGWLLIFDNVEKPEQLLGYLPTRQAGHVLITSRNPHWEEVANSLSVAVFERKESVAFLCHRKKRDSHADIDAASRLAETLGDLPLALEQAAAYIRAAAIPLDDYLQFYQTRHEKLWRDAPLPLGYLHTVATTWDMAMEKASGECEASTELLNLCAYLGPDNIPRSLLSAGNEHPLSVLPTVVTDTMESNRAIMALGRYSLVQVTEESLSIHRLVQSVVRDKLPPEARKQWSEAAVCLVDAAFPEDSDEAKHWPKCQQLLPHALASAEHAETLEVAPKATSHLLNQMGLYFLHQAQFSLAEPLYGRALAIAQRHSYDGSDIDQTTYLNGLGSLFCDTAQYEEAEQRFREALSIAQQAGGPTHPVVATSLNNLAALRLALARLDIGEQRHQQAQERLQKAEQYLQQALAIDQTQPEDNRADVANDLTNLGGVYRIMGNLDRAEGNYDQARERFLEAKGYFERSFEIDEDYYGENEPQFATCLNNLGGVHRALGDLVKRDGLHREARAYFLQAKGYFERALRIVQAVFPEGHPDVARCHNNLGMVLQELGSRGGAKAHFQTSLDMYRDSMGDEHPYTQEVKSNLDGLHVTFHARMAYLVSRLRIWHRH